MNSETLEHNVKQCNVTFNMQVSWTETQLVSHANTESMTAAKHINVSALMTKHVTTVKILNIHVHVCLSVAERFNLILKSCVHYIPEYFRATNGLVYKIGFL